jgi:hypothetical protein
VKTVPLSGTLPKAQAHPEPGPAILRSEDIHMWRKMSGILLLACLGPTFAQVNPSDRVKAQHDADDQKWAQKAGLPVSEVQAIRIAAGVYGPTNFSRIVNLDASSLKQRNHILFVEGPCIKLHVIERGANGFTEVWSLSELPRPAWKIGATNRPARGICPQAPRLPSAHATADGRIVLEVPILLDPFERTRPVDTYFFTWDGAKYVLEDSER